MTFISSSYFTKKISAVSIFILLFVFVYVLLGYIISGPIHVKNVELVDLKRNNHLIVNIPFLQDYTPNDTYYYTLNLPPHSYLDYLFSLRLASDICIAELEINDQEIALDTLKHGNLCSSEGGINLQDLPLPASSSRHVLIGVWNRTNGHTGLRLVRDSYKDSAIIIAIIIAIIVIYLQSLLFTKNWQSFKRIHYIWFLLAVFILSFCPYGDDNKYHYYPNDNQWWWWAIFLGNGLVITLLAFMGASWPPTQKLYVVMDRLQQRILKIPPGIFVTGCAATFFALTACLSQLLFHGLPHIGDTQAQYMQGHIFAQGKLFEASHPLRQFFDFQNVINNGKYYSETFPGHPMLLAIGQLLGAPWLVNPLMGALTVWVVFLLAQEIGGKAAGYIAAVLMLVSPMIVFMSSEYMNHVSCMFFLMLFLYAYVRMYKTRSWKYGVLAGCGVGFAFLIRVQSAVPFALPIAIHAIWTSFFNPRKYFINSLAILATFSFFVAFLLYYQYGNTGNPFVSGYEAKDPGYAQLKIFDLFHGNDKAYLWNQLQSSKEQILLTHQVLFCWPTSSFFGVFLLYLLRLNPPDAKFLLLPLLGQYIGFFFIFKDNGSNVFFPNRYVYEASATIIILTSIAVASIGRHISHHKNQSIPYKRSILTITLIVLTVIAVPYQIINLYHVYANNYYAGNWGYYDMLSNTVEKPALVFIKPYPFYRFTYFTQPPEDRNPIIFAQDLGPEDQKLMDYYPHRHIYLVNGYQVTKLK